MTAESVEELAKPAPIFLETDQTRCYDAEGNEIDCNGTGQDGALPKEHGDWRDRFKTSGDLVKDRVTGRIWPKNAALQAFPSTWPEAAAFVETLRGSRAFGRDNWRLPSRSELFSLISHQQVNPALPEGHPFDDVFPGYYWTGTGCARLQDQAWYAHLGGGRLYRGMKHGSYMVWPVSAPEPLPHFEKRRFEIGTEGARDRETGRIWCRKIAGTAVSWRDAVAAAAAINAHGCAGRNDWRLPTIRELESLVDLRRHSPALPAGHPFGDVPDGFWSSTTSVYEPHYAWVLYARDGAVGVGFKPIPEFHVLAVTV